MNGAQPARFGRRGSSYGVVVISPPKAVIGCRDLANWLVMPSRVPAEPRPAEDGQPEFPVRPAAESEVQLAGTGLVAGHLTSGFTGDGAGTPIPNPPSYLVISGNNAPHGRQPSRGTAGHRSLMPRVPWHRTLPPCD